MTADVAIVGAGAAGIGAARALAAAGRSLVLLEASVRVGGRAWTHEIDGLPLDLGCGWLHSAERNDWTRIASEAGFTVDRIRAPWRGQWRDLGFAPDERAEADAAVEAYGARLTQIGSDDRASGAIDPACRWNAWLEALSGYINGAAIADISAADYLAYDRAASNANWRVAEGYGALVVASLPEGVALRLATPVDAIELDHADVRLVTPRGTIMARTAILTVSSAVLAAGAIRLPGALDDRLHAAAGLPLGLADKIFLALDGAHPFERETHLIGDPRDPWTGSYTIMPLGRPVIECFVGGPGAEALEGEGAAAGYAFAIGELANLVGNDVRRHLRPLAASAWRRMDRVRGSYSHALPGRADARTVLAAPFDARLFFAGEATHPTDFSTAHGAYKSGRRAAAEVLALG